MYLEEGEEPRLCEVRLKAERRTGELLEGSVTGWHLQERLPCKGGAGDGRCTTPRGEHPSSQVRNRWLKHGGGSGKNREEQF